MPEGHCNCGSVKVIVPELPKESALCYCANCKRAGATAFSVNCFVEKSAVEIKDPHGVLKSYVDSNTKSGNSITRQFCGNCGTPVATLLGPDSPSFIIKGGIFDDIPPANNEFFKDSKPSWLGNVIQTDH